MKILGGVLVIILGVIVILVGFKGVPGSAIAAFLAPDYVQVGNI
jgi:hypothetical protein